MHLSHSTLICSAAMWESPTKLYPIWFVFPTDSWCSLEKETACMQRARPRASGKKWFSMEEKWCLLLTYGADEFLFFHPRCGKQPKEGFLWSLERFSSQLHRAFLVSAAERNCVSWWFERAGFGCNYIYRTLLLWILTVYGILFHFPLWHMSCLNIILFFDKIYLS